MPASGARPGAQHPAVRRGWSGDRSPQRVNLSTMAAIVAAGAGARVVKHGRARGVLGLRLGGRAGGELVRWAS
ncbi:hypothetical protein LT493_25875 [Streptomyces tricolor]|nr:hypothetical protein [Streptomyces tricolor]